MHKMNANSLSQSTFLTRLVAGIQAAASRLRVRRADRSLRLCETLPLGERRCLLLVQCEQHRYLIGATAQMLTLIERLDIGRDPAPSELSAVDDLSWKGLR
jgi:flagellar biogenesis protein FliO